MKLLVIDVQKGIMDERLYRFQSLVKNIQILIETARKQGIEVIYDYFVVAKPWFSFLNVPTFRIICTIYFLFLYQLYSYRETVKK